jgi:hypothetical protein
MNKIYILLVTIFSLFTGVVQADDVAVKAADQPQDTTVTEPAPTPIDPTTNFFMSLASCVPGDYLEKNIYSDTIGSKYLNQKILGIEKSWCHVMMMTPDGRVMDCNFDPQQLSSKMDQHFLDGITTNSLNDPSKQSIDADQLWSQMKNDHCSF